MQNFESLVNRIYEAATESECWPSVLHEIGQSADCAGGIILLRHSSDWAGWRCSSGLADGAKEFMDTDALSRSKTTSRLLEIDRAGFVSDTDMFSENEYRADPLFTEWARPNNLFHGAATGIEAASKDLIVVQVQRRAGQNAFSTSDIELLDAYRPHLARAGLLAVRLQFEKLYAAAQALELVGLPAAILDPSGAVLCANNRIQNLTHHISWLPGNRLALSDPKADTSLGHSIEESKNTKTAVGRSIPFRGKGERSPAVVHLIPIAMSARDLFEGGITALIIDTLTIHRSPGAKILQALFDLTPAESTVASCIGKGWTLERIAKHRGCGVETVRSQLKSVFAKTNTRRQSEIASLLAGFPKMPR